MRISFNWLKKYIDIVETPERIADLLTHAGLEVESVEPHESIPGGLKDFVIGHVLTCERHPNADKLSKTIVEVGNGTTLPIVCGASNVRQGQKVIVALPGAQIKLPGKEPFVIQKTKIRGEVSEGMICAEDELGVGESHEGILVLDTDLPVGTPAAQYFNIESDSILEIGLTPNRADAASHFGVARELKALLRRPLKWTPDERETQGDFLCPISVYVENQASCPRYAGIYIKGITVKPSPEWLQKSLLSIGLNPINNVVDVTNYILHGLGQPLHAFDGDKIQDNTLVVKNPLAPIVFTTLDGKERKLEQNDLIIYDQRSPLCIAGVFGGLNSGVTEATKNIFIESAYFLPDTVRKTAQRLGIKTDSSFRFERGTNPDLVLPALQLAAELILQVAGGQVSNIIDTYPDQILPFPVTLKWDRLNQLIGETLPKSKVKEILQDLEISVLKETESELKLEVPPYRVDVTREADIIEDILRVYGYNNIQTKPYLSTDFLAAFPPKDLDKTKRDLGRFLVAKGYYEVYTNSLTQTAYLRDEQKAVKIVNALSSELNVMRQSLIPSGLQVIAHNLNRKQKDVKLFENGFVYQMGTKPSNYEELQRLSILQTGSSHAETWQQRTQGVTFHEFKNTVSEVLNQLGVTNIVLNKVPSPSFHQSVEVVIQNKGIGVFGSISKDVLAQFDIKQDVFAAELDLNAIFALKQKPRSFQELPKYPEVRRDLSLVIDKKIRFEELERLAKKVEPILLKRMNVFDVYEGETLGKDKKSYSISYILMDENKTLTDHEIEAVMSRMIESYEKEINALIRR